MLTKTEKSFSLLFLGILILDLVCGSNESLLQFRFVTKPAVLISLIVFFLRNRNHLNSFTKNITLLALVFSLFGDILLIFDDKSPNFFIAGLASFLLAHIMYVLIFLKKRNPNQSLWLLLFLLILYAVGLFYFIKDGLGDMLIPVILYVLAIFSMVTSAYSRKGNLSRLSFNLVLIGALLFMFSDSLIALERFYRSFPFSSIAIMLTYGVAQLLIILGILKQENEVIS